MRTTFDQNRILYDLLMANTGLKTAITGQIYSGVRPGSSKKEDVVINSLPITAGQLQDGVANVNIYVPGIQSGGILIPNETRMQTLTALALLTLEAHGGANYQFYCEAQTVLDEPDTGFYYVNIRIKFRHFNF